MSAACSPVTSLGAGDPAIDADAARAEELLFDLAGELRRAPLNATLPLHIRALQIKRILTRWSEQLPDDASRRTLIDELLELHRELRALRERLLQ